MRRTGPTIEQRRAEIDDISKQIHNLARTIADLRRLRRRKRELLWKHERGWEHSNNAVNCKLWREKQKAKLRAADPIYVGRKYKDDAKAA